MARVAEIIKNILLIWTNIVPQLEIAAFIDELDDSDAEKNYEVFSAFAEKECSSSLLGILYRLGHFAGEERILKIAAEIVSARQSAEKKEEEDIGGHINFLLHYRHRHRSQGE